MTGLLICAAVAGLLGWAVSGGAGDALGRGNVGAARSGRRISLALIAVALWLAYAAGAQP